jgi:hypothetical protein
MNEPRYAEYPQGAKFTAERLQALKDRAILKHEVHMIPRSQRSEAENP